jgi:hypothetical protein
VVRYNVIYLTTRCRIKSFKCTFVTSKNKFSKWNGHQNARMVKKLVRIMTTKNKIYSYDMIEIDVS